MSRMKVTLPDNRTIEVEEIVGPDEFRTFLKGLQPTQPRQPEPKQNRFSLFSRNKEPVRTENIERYALYQNGEHLALYVVQGDATGLTIEHCAPTNGRPVTPEVKPAIDNTGFRLIDVSREQRGIGFNSLNQKITHSVDGEAPEAFKARVVRDALGQIQHRRERHVAAPIIQNK